MKTVYINTKEYGTIETIDQFTQGEDSPANLKAFNAYVRSMVQEYRMSGQSVYSSSRCTNDYKNK
jgi:hypothetical protein